jgi:hypothetical protein
LTLALIVDEQGFAKYSHLYAGNQQFPEEFKILSFSRFEPKFTYNNVVLSQNSHHDDVLRSSKFLF